MQPGPAAKQQCTLIGWSSKYEQQCTLQCHLGRISNTVEGSTRFMSNREHRLVIWVLYWLGLWDHFIPAIFHILSSYQTKNIKPVEWNSHKLCILASKLLSFYLLILGSFARFRFGFLCWKAFTICYQIQILTYTYHIHLILRLRTRLISTQNEEGSTLCPHHTIRPHFLTQPTLSGANPIFCKLGC